MAAESDTADTGHDLRGSTREPIGVVIPCYQAEATIEAVLAGIDEQVSMIFCIDDASTDGTREAIERAAKLDPRVRLRARESNGGVGAAMVDGYRAAVEAGLEILVKVDSDGQMDASLIKAFVEPIRQGEADYVKGNRFYSLETVRGMPASRLLGNAGLSFLSKISSGYWNLFDPTNGYTAIHAEIVRALPLEKLHRRYFFESDLLFRLQTLGARVLEVPMNATYGEETSQLSELRSLFTFWALHLRNAVKRLVYTHLLRNFSLAAANLLLGLALLLGGGAFGVASWIESLRSGNPATPGTVMLAALPCLVGVQLILSFLAYDMSLVPTRAIHPRLRRARGGFPGDSD